MHNTFRLLFVFWGLFLFSAAQCQQFKFTLLSSSVPTNLRGLCPIDDKTIWTCGNNGHIGVSSDGGKNWQWVNPAGYEKSDFRDVYAFDAYRAVVMATTRPALILRTEDGGKSWQEAFRSDDTMVFLDAIDFWDDKMGVCVGDWIGGNPYFLETKDSGNSWLVNTQFGVVDTDAERQKIASFAASGTCVRYYKHNGETGFATAISAGNNNLIHIAAKDDDGEEDEEYDFSFYQVPYKTNSAAQGIFSICIDTTNKLIWVAGGDYTSPESGYSAVSTLDDETFILPPTQVSGYRSCIELFYYKGMPMVIACGPNGADVSLSDQKLAKWKKISQLPFNVAIKAQTTNTVFLAGKQGTIYKMVVE